MSGIVKVRIEGLPADVEAAVEQLRLDFEILRGPKTYPRQGYVAVYLDARRKPPANPPPKK